MKFEKQSALLKVLKCVPFLRETHDGQRRLPRFYLAFFHFLLALSFELSYNSYNRVINIKR